MTESKAKRPRRVIKKAPLEKGKKPVPLKVIDEKPNPYSEGQLIDFSDMFNGCDAGYGAHVKKGEDWENWTIKGEPKLGPYRDHLDGNQGLGIVPIRMGDTCSFSCFDWDEHHETGKELDLEGMSRKIASLNLPAVLCRSKGGGAHIITFYLEPVSATKCRSLMAMFAERLGISDTGEVFPKQAHLAEGQIGNTINLPYFACGANTERWAVVDGARLTFSQFMRRACDVSIDTAEVDRLLGGEHASAPPCIQHIIMNGSNKGNRNEAMFNIALYMRKRYPEEYRDKLYDVNAVAFSTPLPMVELRRVISSTAKKEYMYRCQESPCRELCNKELCLEREYGIQPEDATIITEAIFCRLRKIKTDPVQWELGVGQNTVCLSTHVLMDYRKMMEAVAEKTLTLLPVMKNNEWWRVLQPLMTHADEIDAPKDATIGGLFQLKLTEFIRRARLPEMDTPLEAVREGLLMSQPVIEYDPAEADTLIAHFRGMDFMEALKRTRAGNITGAGLWNALRRNGVENGKVRVGKVIVAVWSVRIQLDDTQRPVPVFKTDF